MTTPSSQTPNVGIIGCGKRGQRHAIDFAACGASIVAVADPFPEAAQALSAQFGNPPVFTDAKQMLAETQPDMVSICTWPQFHCQGVLDAIEAGVKAIHCEKPMAPSWSESKTMHRAAVEAGVQLTFSHQRRFGAGFMKSRELAQSGAVGEIFRIEGFCSNLFDWGTHWFDMFFFYNSETPAQWVMGQADTSNVRPVFGVPIESGGLSYIRFQNGVYGLLATGKEAGGRCATRIIGSDGLIEVLSDNGDNESLRVLRAGSAWETPPMESVSHGKQHENTVRDAIECLNTGREPEASSFKAMRAMELIFATYESARRGGRVDLPLEVEDASLALLLESRSV